MQTIRRAALAPAHPSSADRAIAAQATAKELQAKQEIQAQEPSLEQTNVPNVEQSNDENIAKPANDTQEFTQRSMMIAAYTAMASLAS